MKERMELIHKYDNGVCRWKCLCGSGEVPEDSWPCNEKGEISQLTPCYLHQIHVCLGCGRIFNCHTGEVLGNRNDAQPVSIAPDFTDYEYQRGGRKLPTYKGYTVDVPLWQFRNIELGRPLEFIPFDSPEGDELMADLLSKLPKDHILQNEVFEGWLRRS
jgi:hypothetical protein